jgi:hypothetical protein
MLVPCFLDANGQPLGIMECITSNPLYPPQYENFDHGIIGKLETPTNIDTLIGDETFTVLL